MCSLFVNKNFRDDSFRCDFPPYQTESKCMLKIHRGVAPGEVRFADVRRNDLHAYGDAITGRVQLVMKVTRIAPAGGSPDD